MNMCNLLLYSVLVFVAAVQTDGSCIRPNSSLVCSNRGECIMGRCYCFERRKMSNQRYSGQYCECDSYMCPYFNNMLCGGPRRGFCDCGVCNCNPGYSGDACGCIESKETCISTNGKICNDQGLCECGICKCNKGKFGPTCEDCMNCEGSCERAKPCAKCFTLMEPGCDDKCDGFNHRLVDALHPDTNKCSFKDEDGCLFEFSLLAESGERPTIYVKSISCVFNSGNAVVPLQSYNIYGHMAALFMVNYCFSNWIHSS